MLLTFEGIDGCGKSTQIKLLSEYFDSKGIKYSLFREPGGTRISEKIRSLLLDTKNPINDVTELLLFSAARSQLIAEQVMPLLNNKEVVILDRFYDSTTAYQGYGRGSAPINKILLLNELATHRVVPDLTFYLRILPEVAARRTASVEKDRMETAGIEFFRKVCAGYDKLAKTEKRIKIVNANQLPEVVFNQVVGYVRNLPGFRNLGFSQ